MFRKAACCAALAFGLLPSPVMADPEKPLDIMKFMREQAASTRTAEPKHRAVHTAAKPAHQAAVKPARPAHQKVAARRKPVPMPSEAAASFASQDDPAVQIVDSDELNAIDRAAPPTPPETSGMAPTAKSNVQMVVAEEFNGIDSKANEIASLPAAASRVADAHADTHAMTEEVHVSWLQWIWSALGNTFAALAMAVHQLTRL
jgi:hypothetical protein